MIPYQRHNHLSSCFRLRLLLAWFRSLVAAADNIPPLLLLLVIFVFLCFFFVRFNLFFNFACVHFAGGGFV